MTYAAVERMIRHVILRSRLASIVLLLAAGGLGYAATDTATAMTDSRAALLVREPTGAEVAFCADDGSYEVRGVGTEITQTWPTPNAAAQALLDEIRLAASSRNPMLQDLDPAVRDAWKERLDTYYTPARSLAFSRVIERSDRSETLFEMDHTPAEGVRSPTGADRWLAMQVIIARHGPEGYIVREAIICADAVLTREGQLLPPILSDVLVPHPSGPSVDVS